MTGLGETPWVDRNLQLAWERIRAVAPGGAASMPVVERYRGRGKVVVQEFGCGHYGCVMPTSVPGVVVKLSSDPTEAFFIAAALELGFDPYDNAGIVRYYAVYQLANAFHRQRPLFVLWREEAFDVGFPTQTQWGRTAVHSREAFEQRRDKQLLRYLDFFKTHANSARERLKRSDDPIVVAAEALWLGDRVAGEVWWESEGLGPQIERGGRVPVVRAVARHLRACAIVAEMMENTDGAVEIGRTLGYYLSEGLLLADVHGNNVGKVERHDDAYDGEVRVVTDPGHAVPLLPRWDAVTIEEI